MYSFPYAIKDEIDLKRVLIQMAFDFKLPKQTGELASLSFGENFEAPKDFRFNDVPHAKWVRSYFYSAASAALSKALTDPTIENKSK